MRESGFPDGCRDQTALRIGPETVHITDEWTGRMLVCPLVSSAEPGNQAGNTQTKFLNGINRERLTKIMKRQQLINSETYQLFCSMERAMTF